MSVDCGQPYWNEGEVDVGGEAYRKGHAYGAQAALHAIGPEDEGAAAVDLAVEQARRRKRMMSHPMDLPDPAAVYVPMTSFIVGFIDGAHTGPDGEAARVTLTRFIEALVLSELPDGYRDPKRLPEYLQMVTDDDGTMRLVDERDDDGEG